jgi:hypothetical protein
MSPTRIIGGQFDNMSCAGSFRDAQLAVPFWITRRPRPARASCEAPFLPRWVPPVPFR